MQSPLPLDPANAEELGNIAEETGAEVLRGALCYPSYSGGWQLGNLDLSEHLDRYRDQELVVIIASIGKAGEVDKEKYVCGICGFALTELGECPRCKMQNEEMAKGLQRQKGRRALFREISEHLRAADEEDSADGEG